MEPNHNIIGPPTELPQPQEFSSEDATEYGVASAPEKRGLKPTVPANPPVQQTNLPVADDPMAAQPSNAVAVSTNGSNTSQGAMIADDTDLIEKEWVIRAKSIVLQTKDDPNLQNKEVNKIKADYMKKRYNKDLKVSEG